MAYGYPPQKQSRNWLMVLLTVLAAGAAAVGGYFASSYLFGGSQTEEARPAAAAPAATAAAPGADSEAAAAPTENAAPQGEETPAAPTRADRQAAGDLKLGADNVLSNTRMEVKFPATPTMQEVSAGGQNFKFWATIHDGKQYYAAYVPERTPGITLDSSILGAMQNGGSTLKNSEDWALPGTEAKIAYGDSPAGPVTLVTALATDGPDHFMLWQVGGEMDHDFFNSLKVK